MPADGEPIIGPVAPVPGLYVAVLHAAVTLAPTVGRLVARELVDGAVEPMLAGCRLDRFWRVGHIPSVRRRHAIIWPEIVSGRRGAVRAARTRP